MSLTCGIPKGLVLGPCLFLLYINDLVGAIRYSSINIYADDTLIYVGDTDIDNAACKLQADIINVASWFENNKLTLNVEKTCTMFVGSKHRLSQSVMPKLFLYHQELDNKTEVKYLGLTIDQHLMWSQHIIEMCNKLRPKVSLLSRIRHYLPFQQTMMVYSALIQSIIDYGCSVWGNSSKSNVLTVQHMQNRCARLITNKCTHEISSSTILSLVS